MCYLCSSTNSRRQPRSLSRWRLHRANNFYMNDYLGSVKNPETALTLNRSLVELFKLGGFNLTKCISNVTNLSLNLHPLKPALTTVRKFLPLWLIRKTHRMFSVSNGDHVTDTLVVSRGVNRKLKDSQRSVLSFVPSVFDPIGLLYRTRTIATERYLAIEWSTVGRLTAKWVVTQIHWMALRLANFGAAHNTSLLFWLSSR